MTIKPPRKKGHRNLYLEGLEHAKVDLLTKGEIMIEYATYYSYRRRISIGKQGQAIRVVSDKRVGVVRGFFISIVVTSSRRIFMPDCGTGAGAKKLGDKALVLLLEGGNTRP